jgi:hypothetical protein
MKVEGTSSDFDYRYFYAAFWISLFPPLVSNVPIA